MEGNTSEIKQVAWGAIALTLFGIFATVVMTYFFIMSNSTNALIADLRQSMLAANYSRIQELVDETEAGRYPLVSSTVNSLSELNDNDLLYVGVHTEGNSKSEYFTYKYITLQLSGVSGTVIKHEGSTGCNYPIDDACRLLMRYTDKKCQVKFTETPYGTGGSTTKLYAVDVYVND